MTVEIDDLRTTVIAPEAVHEAVVARSGLAGLSSFILIREDFGAYAHMPWKARRARLCRIARRRSTFSTRKDPICNIDRG